MMIHATMDLDQLTERMGEAATQSEACVLRHMLAETLEGIDTAEIDPDQWSSMVELAVQHHRELVGTLATLCTRNEAGQHFTETADPDVLDELESLGLLLIHRPTHEATGIPYGSEHWTLEATEAGIDAVERAEVAAIDTDFEPVLTSEEIEQGEENTRKKQPIRRAALQLLKLSGAEMRAMVADDEGAETFLQLLEHIGDFMQWRERETELLGSAYARLAAVLLQREEVTA